MSAQDVPHWMELIEAERARIAARLAAPSPEITPEPWSRQQDILACFPLRADWEQIKIMENADGNPERRYQNNWEDYWKQYNELVAGKEEPYPAPAVTSLQESAFLAPAPVHQLAEMAREAGWDVRTQYAQGYPPHGSTGRPGALKDSIAVIFGNHPLTDRQAYACYEKTASGSAWTWSGIMVWGPDLPPFTGCGVTDLKTFLSNADMPAIWVAKWVADIKALRAAQADDTKIRTAMRKEIRDLDMAGESISRICEHAASIYSPEEVRKILATVSKKAEKEGMQ